MPSYAPLALYPPSSMTFSTEKVPAAVNSGVIHYISNLTGPFQSYTGLEWICEKRFIIFSFVS